MPYPPGPDAVLEVTYQMGRGRFASFWLLPGSLHFPEFRDLIRYHIERRRAELVTVSR